MNTIAINEDRARWEKNVSFCTQKVDMEDGHRLDFTIMINSKRFIVTILPTPSPDDPVTPLISRYLAQDITITKKLMGTGFIARVSAKGQDMCCKVLVPHQVKAVQREYECLKKIADSQYAHSINAPRLIGFVVDHNDDKGAGIGILEEYIPHVMTLGRFLKNENTEIVAIERRRKWAE
ncbi:hypothetical protein LSUB1_G006282 [Lachnellula subtilissima]|uniref:Uncharacterized protein n=1 Tax=Lachnellula subtilissima TaxID=602034 RepID=A0A8H8RHM3_9HELO|nr:hypothetical protein LSUB1_G006282 [Lachnellula subtilissima]